MAWTTPDWQRLDLELIQPQATRHKVAPPRIPPDWLLCEMVADRRALAVWENEGGNLGD